MLIVTASTAMCGTHLNEASCSEAAYVVSCAFECCMPGMLLQSSCGPTGCVTLPVGLGIWMAGGQHTVARRRVKGCTRFGGREHPWHICHDAGLPYLEQGVSPRRVDWCCLHHVWKGTVCLLSGLHQYLPPSISCWPQSVLLGSLRRVVKEGDAPLQLHCTAVGVPLLL